MTDKIIEAILEQLEPMDKDLLLLIYKLIVSIRERT